MPRAHSSVIAVVVCVAAVLVLCWRMLHGFDFTDESFYITLPYRFVLGDRPFVDELNVAQTSGLLVYPFLKLYVLIVGDTTGIFLFVRALLVVMFGLVGWSAYALARLCIPRPAALLAGTMCMCFVPYSMPGLSYNTLGMSLLAAGLFIAARALLRDPVVRPPWRTPMFWAGFAHGAAALAYPSLLLVAAATAIAVFALSPVRRRRTIAMYVGGGLVFAALVSPLFFRAGLHQLRVVTRYSLFMPLTRDVALHRLWELVELHPEWISMAIAAVGSMRAARRVPLLVASIGVALPLLSCRSGQAGYMASLGFVSSFAIVGPLLAVAVRERRTVRVLLVGIVVPSVVAAGVISFSSSNGALSAGVGLYPAAIVSAIILVMFIAQTTAAARWPAVHPYLALAPTTAVAVLASYLVADGAYYRDGPRSQMTEYVTFGPCKGLYTTPRNAEVLDALTRDIHDYVQGPRALFFYDLPLAYLIAQRRPMVSSSWIFAAAPRHLYDMELFKKWAKPGELVIFDWDHHYPLEVVVNEHSDILAIRPFYTVYRIRERIPK